MPAIIGFAEFTAKKIFLTGDSLLVNLRAYAANMEIREMRSLAALAETGSIVAAASRCCLSPAAVHKHLKTLEDEVGSPLYEKRGGRLFLSQAGQLVLPFVREILMQYEAAFASIGEWREAKRGLVRVGAGPSFSSYLLPALVKRFRRAHPGVEVFVETGGSAYLAERLVSGALDLIFDVVGAPLDEHHLVQVALWKSPAGFVAASSDRSSRMKLREIEKRPFILFQKGTRMESVVQSYFDGLNFRPKVVMRSDSSEAIKSMIRAGLGVSLLFLWNVSSEGRSSAYRILKTDASPLVAHMALLRVRASYTPRPVGAFIEIAKRTGWRDLHLA
jgi:DNA-binding transcriptional LysR family regulator